MLCLCVAILLCALFDVSSADAHRGTAHLWNRQAFQTFVRQFNKRYSPAEYLHRKKVFFRNLHFIVTADVAYSLGLNEHADLTTGEFQRKMHGHKHNPKTMNADFSVNYPIMQQSNFIAAHKKPPKHVVLQASKNWADEGMVSRVMSQNVLHIRCGSCYSFAAASTLESALAIRTRSQPFMLSRQQIVDCSNQLGCMGGTSIASWNYVMRYGLCASTGYPYKARKLACRSSKCRPAFDPRWLIGYNWVHPLERALMHAVLQQPLSVAIHANEYFRTYIDGVFAEDCGMNLNHAVVLTGYGTDRRMVLGNTKYWWIQNSWGSSWGIQGYAKVLRHAKERGLCGLLTLASYPVLSNTI